MMSVSFSLTTVITQISCFPLKQLMTLRKLNIAALLACLLIPKAQGLFSQTKPDDNHCPKIILNYPQSLNFDSYSFRDLQIFTDEVDLISGSKTLNDRSDTLLVNANYDLPSGRGILTMYYKKSLVLSGEFMLSAIKERGKGDSITCYRDVIRDGVWLSRYRYDTTDVLRYVFDKGELMSVGYYQRDTLLEGGKYKGGKSVGEWLILGDYLQKCYYNNEGDLIYVQVISRSDGKIKRELHRELLEKTTTLEDCWQIVDFWYIVHYDEQEKVSSRGHYIYSAIDASGDSWNYIPYGLHEIYENGKVTRKKYPKMPTEVKYSIEKFDADGRSYQTDYIKKIN